MSPQRAASGKARMVAVVALALAAGAAAWFLARDGGETGPADSDIAASAHGRASAADTAARFPAAEPADKDPTTVGGRPRQAAPARVSDEEALALLLQEALEDPVMTGRFSPRELRAELSAEARDDAWHTQIAQDVEALMGALEQDFGDSPTISHIDCRQTLCEVLTVTPQDLIDTPADWTASLQRLGETDDPPFVASHNTAKRLPDGRLLYITYLVR
ncbi:hypothetical protein LDO32_05380 [Luteimonas sp. Y-2-2-4F]|nr:hypothetical protein [Luteimonas sp. Y-2-2-4F]MCD9031161.1 hypothetical protein [Luteimonas sp. Y-2-2-4F]